MEKPLPKIRPGDMLNGAVCAQYKKCGKANCRCARGELHGPYYYRFQWHDGRVIKWYIPLSQVDAVTAACERHRRLQKHLLAGRRRFQMMISELNARLKEMKETDL